MTAHPTDLMVFRLNQYPLWKDPWVVFDTIIERLHKGQFTGMILWWPGYDEADGKPRSDMFDRMPMPVADMIRCWTSEFTDSRHFVATGSWMRSDFYQGSWSMLAEARRWRAAYGITDVIFDNLSAAPTETIQAVINGCREFGVTAYTEGIPLDPTFAQGVPCLGRDEDVEKRKIEWPQTGPQHERIYLWRTAEGMTPEQIRTKAADLRARGWTIAALGSPIIKAIGGLT